MNNQDEVQLQSAIIQTLDLNMEAQSSFESFKEKLIVYINGLINDDFEKLIFLLYKTDVEEKKLKSVLSSANTDAASIIADLIIERQLQKIRSRKEFRSNENVPEDEQW